MVMRVENEVMRECDDERKKKDQGRRRYRVAIYMISLPFAALLFSSYTGITASA